MKDIDVKEWLGQYFNKLLNGDSIGGLKTRKDYMRLGNKIRYFISIVLPDACG